MLRYDPAMPLAIFGARVGTAHRRDARSIV
jgi:hypothetical protein